MAKSGRDIQLEDVHEILGRALVDSDFRKSLLDDTESTIGVLGYNMTPTSLQFFKALKDDSFLVAAEKIENRLGGRPIIALWL